MSNANGRPRIQLIGPKKAEPEYITRAQAEQLAQSAYDAAHRMIEHYMRQIPGLVATMLGDALTAHGLTLQPPPAADDYYTAAADATIDRFMDE